MTRPLIEIEIGIITTLMALFLVAEAAVLYAVASGTITTFLVITPLAAMVMMLLAMVGSIREAMATAGPE
jgi:hypothetical protein